MMVWVGSIAVDETEAQNCWADNGTGACQRRVSAKRQRSGPAPRRTSILDKDGDEPTGPSV